MYRKSALALLAAALAILPALRIEPPSRPPAEAAGSPRPSLVSIGRHPLGGQGFNGDVWSHGLYAYVGTWGLSFISGGCPATGVRILDLSDPLNPVLAATAPGAAGARQSEVQAAIIATASFDGHLMVNSDEACAGGGFNGIQIWEHDAPNPPVELDRFPTGPVHNIKLFQRGDRAFVLLAVPNAEVFGPSGGYPASDLQIVEVTDPSNATLVGQWTIGRDAGLAFGSPALTDPSLPPGSNCAPPPGTPALCRGSIPVVYLHDISVSADGNTAYLSYWDAGVVILDISDVTAPSMIARISEPITLGSNEGNAHSATPAGNNLLLVGDEDFTAGPWGFLRIFDITNPAAATQVGYYATPHATQAPPPDNGWYTIHHPMVSGNTAIIGWYSDGVRVVDFSTPSAPKEVASFVPPGVPDPHNYLPPNALFWAAHAHGQLVVASDMNAGLYVMGDDNDKDGCGDLQEAPTNAATRGGRRNAASFWDFFDTPTGNPAARDRAVAITDIVAIVGRFGSSGSTAIDPLSAPPAAPAYHTAFDRTLTPGGDPWDTATPSGQITIQDIALSVQQFGHSCAS
jgi:hypothetical protein